MTAENRGRGRPRVDAVPITVRVPPHQIAALDAWISERPEPRPSRPEAMRVIVDEWMALSGRGTFPPLTSEAKTLNLHRLWDLIAGTVEKISGVEIVKVAYGLEARRAAKTIGAIAFTDRLTDIYPPDPMSMSDPNPVMRYDVIEWLARLRAR